MARRKSTNRCRRPLGRRVCHVTVTSETPQAPALLFHHQWQVSGDVSSMPLCREAMVRCLLMKRCGLHGDSLQHALLHELPRVPSSLSVLGQEHLVSPC